MILISKCLAGENCKYNGQNNLDSRINQLVEGGKGILVCPEELGGLPTPRDPSECKDGRVISNKGVDVTEEFERGALLSLKEALQANCSEAILQERSPSCGVHKIYDGTHQGVLIPGEGITTKLLRAQGIQCFTVDEFFEKEK